MATSNTSIAVLGASGRMGRALIELIGSEPDLELCGAWLRPGDERSGKPIATWHPAAADSAAVAGAELHHVLRDAGVAVDFTLPAATDAVLEAVVRRSVPLVCGVTGLDARQRDALRAAAEAVAVVYDRNMSVGLHIVNHLLRETASRLGDEYDVEITEAHHRGKRDAPSGTALMLGETVARARGGELARRAVYARHGESGPRESGSIGFSVIRAGHIVGEHTVLFAAPTERISIRHEAQDRAAFAAGALLAARWVRTRPPGLYGMKDVLGTR